MHYIKISFSDFWPGLILLALMAISMSYTADMLGKGWVILQKRFPEYHVHCRKPYPEMGMRAMGPFMKLV